MTTINTIIFLGIIESITTVQQSLQLWLYIGTVEDGLKEYLINSTWHDNTYYVQRGKNAVKNNPTYCTHKFTICE